MTKQSPVNEFANSLIRPDYLPGPSRPSPAREREGLVLMLAGSSSLNCEVTSKSQRRLTNGSKPTPPYDGVNSSNKSVDTQNRL